MDKIRTCVLYICLRNMFALAVTCCLNITGWNSVVKIG